MQEATPMTFKTTIAISLFLIFAIVFTVGFGFELGANVADAVSP